MIFYDIQDNYLTKHIFIFLFMTESLNTCLQDQFCGESDGTDSTENYSSEHVDHHVKEICHSEHTDINDAERRTFWKEKNVY